MKRVTDTLKRTWPDHPLAPMMRAFQSLRGVDWLTAATVVAECGDFSQFTHPRQVVSFLGLVPMEASSGQSRHQGGLTKTGNAHVRLRAAPPALTVLNDTHNDFCPPED